MYRLYIIKRTIEDIIISPFIFIGRMIARFRPMKREYRVFFFFPFYHTGGAEKVHAQIAAATGGGDCIIFFTRKSADRRFWNDFKNSGCEIRDISKFCDNKWLYFLNLFYRGIVTGYINRQKLRPVVFNGQCNFGYKISPWVKKSIDQIELIHSLNSFSYIRIPYLPFIKNTVMISRKRIEDHKELYRRFNIPIELADRIIYICNAIPLPSAKKQRPFSPFRVLYSGRPGPEKRINLVTEMAKELNTVNKDIQFEILGNMQGLLNENKFSFIKFHGNIDENEKINTIYANVHVLLITSITEGFPMVIIEAMANGCAIMSTAVGDIPYHITNNENGFLFSSIENELMIINEGCKKILQLKNDPEQWKIMSENNIAYASEHFGIQKFNAAYRALFKKV